MTMIPEVPRWLAAALAAVAVVGWTACTAVHPPEEPPVPVAGGLASLPPLDAQAWIQGDLHVHSVISTDTDRERPSTPERIRETAIARGLEFIVITDHSNATGSEQFCRGVTDPNACVEQPHLHNRGPEFPLWQTAATLRDRDLLLVDGNEASPVDMTGATPRGHVGIVPLNLETFDRDWIIVDRPSGAVSGGWAVTQAQEHGGWAVVNHPFSPGGFPPWIEYDWTSFAYDALEVYNGGAAYDDGDDAAFAALLCDWSQGRYVAAVGASDNHRVWVEPPGDLLNPPLGAAQTSVLVRERTWPAVADALAARRTIAHDPDAFVEFRVRLPDGRVLLPGSTAAVAGPVKAVVEVAGWSKPGGVAVVLVVPVDGCEDPRPVADVERRRPTVATRTEGEISLTSPGDLNNVTGRQGRFELTVAPGEVVAVRIKGDWSGVLGRGQAIPTPVALTSR